jgi:uncharacterized protein YceK
MFRAMRFPFLLFLVVLSGCSTVKEQAQVAQQKAANLGDRIETKVTQTSANVQLKTRTFWQWLTGSGDDSSTKKPAKRRTADSAAATPAPLDTVPQQYVGSQSR